MTKRQSTYIATGREKEVFRSAWQCGLPVLLKGPTGCGKTRFVQTMAEELARPLITVACHEDLTAGDLVGRFLLQSGDTKWLDGPLTRAVRTGAICYLDEVVEARADTTVVVHPLADHRRELNVERLGEHLLAPDEFMLVVSYNPGYQSVLKDLKPSTRQRMVAIELAYPDPAIEVQILCNETGIDEALADLLVRMGQAIRTLDHEGLAEVASTRTLVSTALLIKAGLPLREAAEAAIAGPLTDDPVATRQLLELVKAYVA
ncbi:CbbQ/NirQ/NorQ/GpvN family protein [Massilia cavernae]|uniref:CbbQ/NirQ/NorQ/GpvN family protein n=1 Tax=Massilia cavernae TaxID=2320864 RepID=A0A418Y7W9_9BURK|nr:CbbQ/NirQ/NorQ/GpvN family protein [Massilia cavernae]RJG27123.1 CbbQ/NirQ/NorQ/GpvN family protein [Massilia cavernae]